jgi:hypothetical protein
MPPIYGESLILSQHPSGSSRSFRARHAHWVSPSACLLRSYVNSLSPTTSFKIKLFRAGEVLETVSFPGK